MQSEYISSSAHIKLCEICQKPISLPKKTTKYCSRECSRKSEYQRHKEEIKLRNAADYKNNKAKRLKTCRAWVIANREKVRRYSARYSRKQRELIRRGLVKEPPQSRSDKHANKLHCRAHNVVNAALKSGKLKRPSTCVKCGRSCRVDGHHADYNKPLDVEWLCRKCHGKSHRSKYHEDMPPLGPTTHLPNLSKVFQEVEAT